MAFRVSEAQIADFHRDGYLFVENFLDAEEAAMVLRAAKGDDDLVAHAHAVEDKAGKKSRLSLWNHPSNDIFGMVARAERTVDTAEKLLGGEVYHYHTKLMLKEPKVGGAWEWHQDYGYWYSNGCLYPDMLSCFIALDPATQANGCLQALRGSHKMGRVEHGMFGTQTGADPERVAQAMKRLELVQCEMAPGTALFFHGNTLHCSAANTSENPRWTLICCYNAAWNDPYKEHHHPNYTPLARVDDGQIRAYGNQALDSQRAYLDLKGDEAVSKKHYDTTGMKGAS